MRVCVVGGGGRRGGGAATTACTHPHPPSSHAPMPLPMTIAHMITLSFQGNFRVGGCAAVGCTGVPRAAMVTRPNRSQPPTGNVRNCQGVWGGVAVPGRVARCPPPVFYVCVCGRVWHVVAWAEARAAVTRCWVGRGGLHMPAPRPFFLFFRAAVGMAGCAVSSRRVPSLPLPVSLLDDGWRSCSRWLRACTAPRLPRHPPARARVQRRLLAC